MGSRNGRILQSQGSHDGPLIVDYAHGLAVAIGGSQSYFSLHIHMLVPFLWTCTTWALQFSCWRPSKRPELPRCQLLMAAMLGKSSVNGKELILDYLNVTLVGVLKTPGTEASSVAPS